MKPRKQGLHAGGMVESAGNVRLQHDTGYKRVKEVRTIIKHYLGEHRQRLSKAQSMFAIENTRGA
ncbi:MAG: hypothetical protein RRC07_12550 [Anaerolineae bacterium]|nr:hypothetical protein [Anaerolineae bacterium]